MNLMEMSPTRDSQRNAGVEFSERRASIVSVGKQ